MSLLLNLFISFGIFKELRFPFAFQQIVTKNVALWEKAVLKSFLCITKIVLSKYVKRNLSKTSNNIGILVMYSVHLIIVMDF